MSLDLGQLASDLGTAYIHARFQQPASMQQPAFTVPEFIPGVGGMDIEGDMPFLDFVKKKKSCRRRRRRLLTDRDFMDLASLKTLTGNNDAFKAAVVKSVRR